MNLNKEIPIKWEALPAMLCYIAAYMVVKAICQEARLAPDFTQIVLQVAAGVLTVAFIIHAMRIPRSSPVVHRQVAHQPSRFEESASESVSINRLNLLRTSNVFEDDL